ncbi:MAG: glycosyltransferase [Candidatus Kryptoniota bacterium]
MMFLSLLEIIAALYLAELTLYSYAAFRSRQIRNPRSNVSPQPKVSIVVAAKDEEKKLPACLDSLLKLAYPRDLLEIIIVNDQSNDSTPSIIDDASKNFIGVKRVDAIESSMLRGKANALSQGIDKATGEFIFLTDADCIVPPSWITGTLKYFDENTGIVGGVTLISQTDKSIYGIQAIDWSFLLTIGAGAATLGKPVACLGNNLVFRKKAYDEIGGYRKIKFSVTEDFALFKAVALSGKWTYTYPMDKLTLIETLPVESLKEVFLQRKRWGTGGKDTGLFGFLTLAPGFLFHWLIILSPFFSVPGCAIFFFLKLLMDSLFVFPTLQHYGKIAHLKFMLYFEIYYLIYVAILPFAVYFGKSVTWKGRKY